jgi:hypothetical protein
MDLEAGLREITRITKELQKLDNVLYERLLNEKYTRKDYKEITSKMENIVKELGMEELHSQRKKIKKELQKPYRCGSSREDLMLIQDCYENISGDEPFNLFPESLWWRREYCNRRVYCGRCDRISIWASHTLRFYTLLEKIGYDKIRKPEEIEEYSRMKHEIESGDIYPEDFEERWKWINEFKKMKPNELLKNLILLRKLELDSIKKRSYFKDFYQKGNDAKKKSIMWLLCLRDTSEEKEDLEFSVDMTEHLLKTRGG